jgi:hypothetical protein
MVEKTKIDKATHVITDDDDDGLESIVDEVPAYPRWLEAGQRWDSRVTATTEHGTNFDNEPCFQFEGELLQPAPNFDSDGNKVTEPIGREIRVNCGQPILERLVRKAERQYGGLVGRRLVVTYKGTVRTTSGKSAKSFDVQVGSRITYADLGQGDE